MAEGASITALTVLTAGPALGAEIVRDGWPKFRTLLGMMFMGAGLFVVSMVDVEFARWLGIIAAVTSWIVNGGPLFASVERMLR